MRVFIDSYFQLEGIITCLKLRNKHKIISKEQIETINCVGKHATEQTLDRIFMIIVDTYDIYNYFRVN